MQVTAGIQNTRAYKADEIKKKKKKKEKNTYNGGRGGI